GQNLQLLRATVLDHYSDFPGSGILGAKAESQIAEHRTFWMLPASHRGSQLRVRSRVCRLCRVQASSAVTRQPSLEPTRDVWPETPSPRARIRQGCPA